MFKRLDDNLLNHMEKNQKLFIVDMESVSIFSDDALKKIALDEKQYLKTPFLFLVASYVRNQSIKWADKNLSYKGKIKTGAWMVYCFEK